MTATTSTEPTAAVAVSSGPTTPDAFTRSAELKNNASIGTLPINEITVWEHIKTVRPNNDHINELKASIEIKGLVEPLVVDLKGKLVAGRHRLGALRIIFEKNPERFAALFPDNKVPVAILPFDADANIELGLAVMIAENQYHRTLISKDFKQLHTMLGKLGYRPDAVGRPVVGDNKSISAVLTSALRISSRTYRRYVLDLKKEERGEVEKKVQLAPLAKIKNIIEKLSTSDFTALKIWIRERVHSAPAKVRTAAETSQARTLKHAEKPKAKPVVERKAPAAASKKKKASRK